MTTGADATIFTVLTPSSQAQQEELDEFTQGNDDQDGSTLNLNPNVSLTPEESGAGLERQSTSQLVQVPGFGHEQMSARNSLGSGGAIAGPSSVSVLAPATETLNQLHDCGSDLKINKASDPLTSSASTHDSGYGSAGDTLPPAITVSERPQDSRPSRFSVMPVTPSTEPPVANLRAARQYVTNNGPRDSIDGYNATLDPTRVEENGMTILHFPEDTTIDDMFNSLIQYNVTQE